VVQADVCRPEEITGMFDAVRAQFGKLDILVSNARPEAAEFFQPPMDITLQQWDTAFDSQAKAFLIAVREASALMPEGGRVVAITYRARKPHRRPATLGGYGFREGGSGVTRSLLRSGTGQTQYHRQCDQPRVDGE
jgi:NAD(P)-dependent dehydrogenase (short-subunit alcohol dehydrogenase family)